MFRFFETIEQKRKRKLREEEATRKIYNDNLLVIRRSEGNSDFSVTGSPIVDGLVGIPSSPLAIAIDMATPGGLFDSNISYASEPKAETAHHSEPSYSSSDETNNSSSSYDTGSSSSSYDSGSSSSSYDSGSSSSGSFD